ncbi:hypothetical protein ES703_87700 [subsurface metagenome]
MASKSRGTLGQWLEARCQEERMSLRQAAQKTGLSHATIGDVTKGNNPSPETIKKLAQAFGSDGLYGKLALEDELLVLAGYRTPRPKEEINGTLARLLDKLIPFNGPQLEAVGHFIDFISKMGRNNAQNT